MPARFFQSFLRTETVGGVVLLAAALAALVVANSPLASTYDALWATRLVVGPESHPLALSARGWVNDGLMAMFFLLVGLEIKRELLVGELSTARQAALPLAAALGGVVVPALIFAALADPGTLRGWAIPTATDIAFALGVLALVAPQAPTGLKVFLAALAIVDDMCAVVVIALFYTAQVEWTAVAMAAGAAAALVGLNLARVQRLAPYLLLGAGLWYFVHESGVHATIAGVVLAFTIPLRTLRPLRARTPGRTAMTTTAPLLRLEHALHGVSAYLVMPVFAFANAGVALTLGALDTSTALAVGLGLLAGKPLGITAAAWIACRAGMAALPDGVSWPMLHGTAWIAGIGFTMSLFIAGLAFGESPAFDAAQVGIMAGSALAAAVGAVVLRRASAAPRPELG